MEVQSTVSDTVRVLLHSRKYPGLFAVIDAEDAPLVLPHKWHPLKDGLAFYAVRCKQIAPRPNRRTKCWRMHRVITGAPNGVEVDHVDRDGLNNTRANLRQCSNAENVRNRSPMKNNTSGFRGVSFLARTGRWKATINGRGQRVHLGYHATAEEAARAYDAMARELHGEFARLNFSD